MNTPPDTHPAPLSDTPRDVALPTIDAPLHLAAALDRRARVLVVDDQPVNVQALYRVFAADHQVFMATNGTQALQVAATKHPDIVLLDVEMPDIDGFEVCRQLKAQEATRDTPVIFVTGHGDERSETTGLEVGAVDFITKPINPVIVRARVRTHLTLKRQADLLRQWVYVDGLTGVANRRYFDDRLGNEWRRSVRAGNPLSLMMIDVDYFKRYNDRYGHQAGDDCLRRVAAALASCLQRGGDLLARYGGEEFACVLPETDLGGAITLAQRMNEAVVALQLPHEASDVAPVVTVSIGVADRAGTDVDDAHALVKLADSQLYAAKTQGRNRCCALRPAAS